MHDLAQYDFDLPPERIAQEPASIRDASRLLVLRRAPAADEPALEHRAFRDLPDFLRPGDLLVLNDTRVVPARLVGRRARTDGRWEGLFLREQEGTWELMCQTRGRLMVGETLLVDPPEGPATNSGDPGLRLVLVSKTPAGRWRAKPAEAHSGRSALELLARYGQVPLPPYIRKGRANEADRERYQTIFADRPGAVAAPTAGLHFTPPLFQALEAKGVERALVTLHVGPGTFQPIQTEDVRQHRVEPEWGELSAATAGAINATRARGGRVVAVGTTSVRVLETAAQGVRLGPHDERAGDGEGVSAWSGPTDLTVCPPFSFRLVDALVTNFHLPRSSLLLLVSAFAGRERVIETYRIAVEQGYRFYSYGDAMLIL
jgi:S-adenosylmethionine:tRNA ribosyltransferase-isomerase